MKVKKILTVLMIVCLAAALCAVFVACEDSNQKPTFDINDPEFKVGIICLHDENSTYDKNFIDAFKSATAELGLTDDQVIIKTEVGENNACKEAAYELADLGCDIIFADSFGHEPFMLEAAKAYPNVQFAHATGTTAHTEKLPNFANAFASIYEGRYLAGIAAGMKLNEMIEEGKITADKAKMGYVGAYTYAEVISGYTAFYLGAKSVCPTVTMEVTFTGSWYDETAESQSATSLIQNGCVLISQHADSMGAPNACEEAGVPNVSYNGSTLAACPNTFIVSSRIDWAPYFKYLINSVVKGEQVAYDWTGTIATGSVVLTDVNTNAAAAGTAEAIAAAKAKLVDGTLNVFDTATFTVTKTANKNVNATVDGNGKLTGYMADVNTDAAYTADTQVVENGVFLESKFRSAPYFDIQIDGITLLNSKF